MSPELPDMRYDTSKGIQRVSNRLPVYANGEPSESLRLHFLATKKSFQQGGSEEVEAETFRGFTICIHGESV